MRKLYSGENKIKREWLSQVMDNNIAGAGGGNIAQEPPKPLSSHKG